MSAIRVKQLSESKQRLSILENVESEHFRGVLVELSNADPRFTKDYTLPFLLGIGTRKIPSFIRKEMSKLKIKNSLYLMNGSECIGYIYTTTDFVDGVYVSKKYRKKGYAKLLMKEYTKRYQVHDGDFVSCRSLLRREEEDLQKIPECNLIAYA